MIKLHPDFKEFIQLLNKHEVKYLIVGGYAVALHGFVRATGDLDIWVKVSKSNSENIIKALHEFGFSSLSIVPDDFRKENVIIQLEFPPFRIDILTSPDGLEFDDCYDKSIEFEIDDISFKIIDKASLLKNKSVVGRSKDLNDIENLT